jgi:hypothetical protein
MDARKQIILRNKIYTNYEVNKKRESEMQASDI